MTGSVPGGDTLVITQFEAPTTFFVVVPIVRGIFRRILMEVNGWMMKVALLLTKANYSSKMVISSNLNDRWLLGQVFLSRQHLLDFARRFKPVTLQT